MVHWDDRYLKTVAELYVSAASKDDVASFHFCKWFRRQRYPYGSVPLEDIWKLVETMLFDSEKLIFVRT